MSKVASRRAKLAELKALKASGKKAFDSYQVEQEADLYEEVDENQYKKIVRDRLNQDDFVVDDNGEGYADDGREDWDRVHHYGSDSEDERVLGGHDRKAGMDLPRRAIQWPSQTDLQQINGNVTMIRPKKTRMTGTLASTS